MECLYHLERFVSNKFPVIEYPSEEFQRTLTLCFNSKGYWVKKCPSLFRNDLLEMDKVLEKLFTSRGEQGDFVKPYSSRAIRANLNVKIGELIFWLIIILQIYVNSFMLNISVKINNC